jgi:hypothetical protein
MSVATAADFPVFPVFADDQRPARGSPSPVIPPTLVLVWPTFQEISLAWKSGTPRISGWLISFLSIVSARIQRLGDQRREDCEVGARI